MELDKRAAKLLKILKRQTPMPQQTARQVREAMLAAGNPFAPPLPQLSYTHDRSIDQDGFSLLLREYSPVQSNENSHAILFFHGGGFVIGSVAEYDGIAAQLAHHSGVRVFSLEYRRAPEYKYPVPHNDAYAAYAWLLENRTKLSIGGIGMCGDSAGGNLAASVCLHARDKGLELPLAQMLWYPMTHGDREFPSRTQFGNDYYITRDDMAWFSEQLLESAEHARDPYFAPGFCDNLAGLPRAFILTAGYDVLRDEGQEYVRQLQAAGVSVEHACYEDMFHGFISFAGGISQGMQAIEQTARFYREVTADLSS